MDISLENMLLKRENCIKQLDPLKHCGTCRYENRKGYREPCESCYNEVIGLPVNPTKWEPKAVDN